MENKFDLMAVLQKLNIRAELLADILGIKYSEMSSMLHGTKNVPDEMIGKLYRLYGVKIFF